MDRRAEWRVRVLWIARQISWLIWIVVGVLFWFRLKESIPTGESFLPRWFPFPVAPVRFAVLVAFIAVAMWVTFLALRLPWNGGFARSRKRCWLAITPR